MRFLPLPVSACVPCRCAPVSPDEAAARFTERPLGSPRLLKVLSQLLGGLAVFASLVFVGYELKRNNDLAVVQSQQELLAISIEMKGLLTDPKTLSLLMTEDLGSFDREEDLLFFALVGGWFDLYELVILSMEKGVLTEEQFIIWMNGMCTLPPHWLEAFEGKINASNSYLKELSVNVQRCLDNELLAY
jgi:hypothetical protein